MDTHENGQAAELAASPGSAVFIPGSRFSDVPVKVKPGDWWYKGFRVVTKGWHWKILSSDGDDHPAKSLKAAMLMIDGWYNEGSVEV